MTQAESEVIEEFCRELALALRRIMGRKVDIPLEVLAVEIEGPGEGVGDRPEEGSSKDDAA